MSKRPASKRQRPDGQLPTVAHLMRGQDTEERLQQVLAFAEKLKERATKELEKMKKARGPKASEVVCFVCQGVWPRDHAYRCGASGFGDCDEKELKELKSRGACAEWAHAKCLGKTECRLACACSDCLGGDFHSNDCHICNAHYRDY